MIYEYHCECSHVFDVVKSHVDMERDEHCPRCTKTAVRAFVPSRLHIVGASVEHAEYNPGLGCIVKNKKHREQICKEKGLQEIGNEKPETLHTHFEKAREEKWEKSWAEADKGWVGNGDVGA